MENSVFPIHDESAMKSYRRRRQESDEKYFFDDRSVSPSTVDSGLDLFDTFDSSLSPSTSFTGSDKAVSESIPAFPINGSFDWSLSNGSSLHSSFNKLYDSLMRVDEDEADGADSPNRLYNRKSSMTTLNRKSTMTTLKDSDNSDEAELRGDNLVAKSSSSTLSSSAPVFIPSSTSKPAFLTRQPSSWTSFSGHVFELPKMLPSYISVPVLPQQQLSFLTSTPVKLHPRRSRSQRVCIYCQRAGYDADMYESHCMRNPITKAIICPVLKENLCKLCGSIDEDWLIHTTQECKKLIKLSGLQNCDF